MFEFNELLKLAVEKDASDIFITVGIPPTLKIDGVLLPLDQPKLTQEDTERIAMKIFPSEEHYREYLRQGDKDFSISLTGVGRFRVVVYNQRGSVAIAIRILSFKQDEKLKFNKPEIVLDLHKKTKGLVLITGPTGSGKSTTLAQIIDLINQNRSCHIITIEDPIEFLHKHNKSIVEQREIGLDAISYDQALKAAMRQAPDVILIGEMRDYETVSAAMRAAETGHLVLSTLHTLGAAKTIDRIVDIFPASQQQQVRVQLSTVLQAVVSQQLIPSEEYGRVPAFEIMIANPAIRNLIREGKVPQIDASIQTGKEEGMISMDVSLANLCNEGIISYEDAYSHSFNPDILKRYIKE
ncbi:MAG: type IV pilus twitching motility protein PilT [Clostridia bacterium]|nr:type IV pilus twitching motility protein PilT [Clostridia bacterium]